MLLTFCELDTLPWLVFWWLLPFALGLWLGYLIWAKWQKMYEAEKSNVNQLNLKVADLEHQLSLCQQGRNDINNELVLARAQVTELMASQESKTSSGQALTFQKQTMTSSSAQESKPVGAKNIYAAIKEDNLQVVEGIGPKMESILKDNGVKTLSSLGSKSVSEIQAILDSFGNRYRIIDPVTWPEQAALAAEGKWQELIKRQKQLSGGTLETSKSTDSKVEKILIKKGIIKKWKQDDLKAIEGIGPKIEALLKKEGIDTWNKLSQTASSELQSILTAAGDRYRLADPTSWPTQAGLARDGKWDELQEYQDILQGGREA